ncbi:MAG: hypothetical protein ABR925_01680 [Acidimicrobiales bacterium]|jgi:hypothetical protein
MALHTPLRRGPVRRLPSAYAICSTQALTALPFGIEADRAAGVAIFVASLMVVEFARLEIAQRFFRAWILSLLARRLVPVCFAVKGVFDFTIHPCHVRQV